MQTQDILAYNMGKKGFTLIGVNYNAGKPILTTNELILEVIKDSDNARLLEGMAVIISNEPPNLTALVKEAIKLKLQNQTGYLLDGTLQILKKDNPYTDYSKMEKAISRLYKKLLPDNQPLANIQIPNAQESLSRNRFPEDLKWNIIGGISYKQLEIQYRWYCGTAKR